MCGCACERERECVCVCVCVCVLKCGGLLQARLGSHSEFPYLGTGAGLCISLFNVSHLAGSTSQGNGVRKRTCAESHAPRLILHYKKLQHVNRATGP